MSRGFFEKIILDVDIFLGYPIPMEKSELREIRKSLDLTQAALAERLGIATNTITRYEIGALKIPKAISLAVLMLATKREQKVKRVRKPRRTLSA